MTTTDTAEPIEITFDSPQHAYDFLDEKTSGRMFSAVFVKKDGEMRFGTWIKAAAIKKDRAGGELKFSPRDKGCYCVYEVVRERIGDRWRMINLEGLKRLKIDGQEYVTRVLCP